ncbi:MAG: cell surface protein, partial [Alistipes sp.]|nr:cell surface protein [Alistipes sp.]
TFRETEPGTYPIAIRASNCDGETLRSLDIEVVETMPYEVRFPTPSLLQTATDRHTFAGRPLYLRPLLEYFEHPQFRWSVDGVPVEGADGRVFRFTPDIAGEYTVCVTVTETSGTAAQRISRNITRADASATASVRVICDQKTETDRLRRATAASSGFGSRVYEYMPAPGQFVNEFTQSVSTPQQAAEYASERLSDKSYVSLGSFGGYIVVGFDHSIVRSGRAYDFAIQGNAIGTSSEPGIVWVMQDTDGNGLPDDEWYELAGSETGAEGTVQDYEVTYYRPAANAPTPWTDSEGRAGTIEINSYHRHEFYYPAWIREASYTLSGTRLSPRSRQDPATGQWSNAPYDWGYADNLGSDTLGAETADGSGQRNGFRIDRAVHRDGTPVDLQYVDFIKVQCGVLSQSGWLGEISTEVFSFEDLSITGNL